MASIFGKQFYQRNDDEDVLPYLRRVIPAMIIIFVIVGIPSTMLVSFLKGRFEMKYMAARAVCAFFGMLIGAPAGLLINDYIRRRKENTKL